MRLSEELELVNYGAGYAWLRAEVSELDLAIRDADQLGQDMDRLLGRRGGAAEEAEPRYVLTQRGRDYLAHQRALAALFEPWPTLAEVERLDAVA